MSPHHHCLLASVEAEGPKVPGRDTAVVEVLPPTAPTIPAADVFVHVDRYAGQLTGQGIAVSRDVLRGREPASPQVVTRDLRLLAETMLRPMLAA